MRWHWAHGLGAYECKIGKKPYCIWSITPKDLKVNIVVEEPNVYKRRSKSFGHCSNGDDRASANQNNFDSELPSSKNEVGIIVCRYVCSWTDSRGTKRKKKTEIEAVSQQALLFAHIHTYIHTSPSVFRATRGWSMHAPESQWIQPRNAYKNWKTPLHYQQIDSFRRHKFHF
jgi:hypothetical protein